MARRFGTTSNYAARSEALMRSVTLTACARQARARGPRGQVGGRVGRRRHLPVRPHGAARRGLLDRHAAADGHPARCTSATCSATRTPTRSPATSACAGSRSSTRWAGTTTACPPSAGCRTTSACGATRRCRTTRTSRRRAEAARKQAIADLPAQLRRAVRPAHGRGRAEVRGAVAPPRPVGRLVADLHDRSASDAQRISQRAFLRNLARGEAYQAEAPTLWDVDFRTAVAQAELEDREQPGAYHRSRSAGVDGGDASSSRRRGPSCSPRASRWSRTPTTSATSRCSARGAHPAVRRARCRCARTTWPTPRRAPASR